MYHLMRKLIYVDIFEECHTESFGWMTIATQRPQHMQCSTSARRVYCNRMQSLGRARFIINVRARCAAHTLTNTQTHGHGRCAAISVRSGGSSLVSCRCHCRLLRVRVIRSRVQRSPQTRTDTSLSHLSDVHDIELSTSRRPVYFSE